MKRIVLLALLALMLASCTALPAEERSFAVALGVDRAQDTWKVHARIPSYQTGGGYITVEGDGGSLQAALAELDAASPMQLHLGQLRMLIFSTQLARSQDFAYALNVLADRHDLRLDAQVAVSDVDMKALMDALKPATGARLSKSLDVLVETRIAQGTAISAALADVLRMGERQSPILLNVTLEGTEVALGGCWPVGADGYVSEPMSPEETQLLSLMLGRMTMGALSLSEGTVRLTSASVTTELTLPTMQDVSVRMHLRCSASPLTEEALSHAVATACLGVLNRLSGMGCDALGLARQAIVHADDMAHWHDMGWPERYREVVWSVSVGVTGPAS